MKNKLFPVVHTLSLLTPVLLLENGPVQQERCYAGHLHWHIDTLVRIYMYNVAGRLGRGQRNRAQTSQSRDLTSPNHTETAHLSSHIFVRDVFENQQGSKLNLNLLTSSWIMILSDSECSGENNFNFLSLSSLFFVRSRLDSLELPASLQNLRLSCT